MKLHYKHIVAILYTIVLFLDRLDLTIVNVTLPTVAKYFNVSLISTDWVMLAFLLSLAVFIPISGWLGENFGFKRIYILSMIVFGAGSTACAFAFDLNFLIVCRFIQGIGGGLLIPVGMTLLYHIYDKEEYVSITSFTFIPSLIAPAIAPFLGGVLLDNLGWRSVFLLSGPICLLLSVVSLFFLKEDLRYRIKSSLDWAGFVLSSIILLVLFYSLSQLAQSGSSIFPILGLLSIVPLILIFIVCEKKNKNPLINLTYFKKALFVKANFIQLCFQSSHFGAIFLIGLFLQVGIGFSASLAGLMMGMQALGAIASSRYSVRLFLRAGPKLPIVAGLLGVAVITPAILFINGPAMLAFGLILFFIRGVFSGLCGAPIQTLSVIDFEKKELGTINSIFNACRQIAISCGVAISSVLISIMLKKENLQHAFEMTPHQAIVVFQWSFYAVTFISLIGAIVASHIDKKS